MEDLDDILSAAAPDRERPCLVEVARALARDGATVAYSWSTGRISATVDSTGVRIKRRLGVVGAGLRVSHDELRQLALACEHWVAERDEWVAYFESCSGYPAGYGSAQYYQPPGRDAEPRKLWSRVMCHEAGRPLSGRDELRDLTQPIRLANGVQIVAERWRVGEWKGPKAGSMIGFRYRLGPKLFLDAQRNDANLLRVGGHKLCLEPGEEDFVAALVRMIEHEG